MVLQYYKCLQKFKMIIIMGLLGTQTLITTVYDIICDLKNNNRNALK